MSAKLKWVVEEPEYGPAEPPCALGLNGHTWTLHIEEGSWGLVSGEPCIGRNDSCVDWIEPQDLGGDLGPVRLTVHVEKGGYPQEVSYVWVEAERVA